MDSLVDTIVAVNNLSAHFKGYLSLKGLDGRYFFVNQEMRRVIGLPEDQIIGKTDDEIFPPHLVEHIKKTDREAYASNSFIEYSNTTLLNGKIESYIVIKCLVKMSSGKPFCLCNIASDEKDKDQLMAIRDKVIKIFSNNELAV